MPGTLDASSAASAHRFWRLAGARVDRPPGARMSTSSSELDQLPRCCPQHGDWSTLAQHLLDEFPGVPVGDIVKEVIRAKEAVASHGLDEADALATGELIARHQLLLLSGDRSDVARLDPTSHIRTRTAG